MKQSKLWLEIVGRNVNYTSAEDDNRHCYAKWADRKALNLSRAEQLFVWWRRRWMRRATDVKHYDVWNKRHHRELWCTLVRIWTKNNWTMIEYKNPYPWSGKTYRLANYTDFRRGSLSVLLFYIENGGGNFFGGFYTAAGTAAR